MSELKIFENPEFGQIRTVAIDSEPWFVGKDVAKALGYQNPQRAIREHVDEEDKGVTEMVTPGGRQQIPIINESGVYSLIFSSKLPKAKKFKRWVTSEVLPSIRKTGAYLTPEAEEKLDTLARRVDAMAEAMPTVVYSRPQPEVSLTGLAKVITVTRRVMLDMGSSPEEVGRVTRSILNTCGFSLPEFKKPDLLSLLDFL